VTLYTGGMTWLNDEELQTWQALHSVLLLLPTALDRQLQRDSKISYLEYYVLAALSERPEGTARLSYLAVLTNAELSRISHLIARLEKRGLVQRRPDPTDGRYTNAVLTEEGLALVRAAAPGHVEAVRRLVFDDLDEPTRRTLHQAMNGIASAICEHGDGHPPARSPKNA
jgi:DNA-binding MarR family transcriptional regulator